MIGEGDQTAKHQEPLNESSPSRSSLHDWLLKVLDRVLIANLWLRTIIVGGLAIALMVYALLEHINTATKPPVSVYLAAQLGFALFVAAIGSALVQWFIMAAPRAQANVREKIQFDSLHTWQYEVSTQLGVMHSSVTEGVGYIGRQLSSVSDLLNAHDSRTEVAELLAHAGVVRAYTSQEAATEDMIQALRHESLTEIRLLGLSLSAWFARRTHTPGQILENLLARGPFQSHDGADIAVKVLLLDPHSAAARLLMSAPLSREGSEGIESLRNEIRATVLHLSGVRDQLSKAKSTARLDVRLYRCMPSFFTLSTETGSFLHNYYATLSSPRPDAPFWLYGPSSAMHAVVHDHFDALWQLASVPDADIYAEKSFGTDQGVAEGGIYNVYTDEERAIGRMAWLIENAKRRVWIQGVSLAPMFRPRLEQAMQKLYDKPSVDTRLLILDPNSEQAFFKSYRDYTFTAGLDCISFEEYCANRARHEDSPIYRNIENSTKHVRDLTSDKTISHFRLRYYDCAPTAFILIADDIALVEQYHYGKGPKATRGVLQLTQEMPLLEYRRPSSGLFRSKPDINPFFVAESSFQHVFDHVSHAPQN